MMIFGGLCVFCSFIKNVVDPPECDQHSSLSNINPLRRCLLHSQVNERATVEYLHTLRVTYHKYGWTIPICGREPASFELCLSFVRYSLQASLKLLIANQIHSGNADLPHSTMRTRKFAA
jgi:hypothetical protein